MVQHADDKLLLLPWLTQWGEVDSEYHDTERKLRIGLDLRATLKPPNYFTNDDVSWKKNMAESRMDKSKLSSRRLFYSDKERLPVKYKGAKERGRLPREEDSGSRRQSINSGRI